MRLGPNLAILGKSEYEFDTYEAEVRREYAFVPEADFRLGREKVLKFFLERPSIYLTEFFRAKYEVRAKKNLERSIKNLRG